MEGIWGGRIFSDVGTATGEFATSPLVVGFAPPHAASTSSTRNLKSKIFGFSAGLGFRFSGLFLSPVRSSSSEDEQLVERCGR